MTARIALESVDDAPGLARLAGGIEPGLSGVSDTIAKAVEDDGSDLRDGASPALRRLRRELREGRARIAERLRALAHDPSLREHLQDDFVTERAGRPVLALRASARGAVPGIVHDSSGSGQTLFVEPFAVVEHSNRLREAESAEREEVARILGELSRRVGEHADELKALVDAVGEIDLALARGTLSRQWRGALVTPGPDVVLRAARHPLLDPATAVPIDLEPGDLRAVVISGPNTGGKTVALKTLGLAAVLHQCGLRPPAEEAALPVFDQVLGDIGDEQSIAMSLSTFSGHVRNLVAILEAATDRSLVLLDEVAGGTDPVEGAALARALLGRLTRQARLTVATSHYPELKEWASATEGVTNAATGFDPETEEPLYRITLGRPGTSHALRIAERLGLAPDLVAEARRNVAPERLRVAGAARGGRGGRGAARPRTAESAASARAAAESSRDAAEARVAELEQEIERVRASARAERERALAEAEKRARRDQGGARRASSGDPRGAPAGARAPPRDDTEGAREGARARPEARCRVRPRGTGRSGAARGRGAPAAHGPARAGRPGRRAGSRGAGDDR